MSFLTLRRRVCAERHDDLKGCVEEAETARGRPPLGTPFNEKDNNLCANSATLRLCVRKRVGNFNYKPVVPCFAVERSDSRS